MTTKTILGMAAIAALAASAVVFGACNDDDGGNADLESASDLSATYENFKRDLEATADIEQAPDDIKNGLKDNCGDLQDGVDSDFLDDFCEDLGNAIDDENQSEYAATKTRFASDVEAQLEDEIADRLRDAGGDDNANDPGDSNNDDNNPLDDDNAPD